jgi:hypothetical protein
MFANLANITGKIGRGCAVIVDEKKKRSFCCGHTPAKLQTSPSRREER